MEKEQIIFYGEGAKEWLDFALGYMNERTGWAFPEPIEKWLFEFVSEVGYAINSSVLDTLYFDNAYVNGVWGHIEDRDWNKEEAKEWLEEGNLLFYDEASGYYVESL